MNHLPAVGSGDYLECGDVASFPGFSPHSEALFPGLSWAWERGSGDGDGSHWNRDVSHMLICMYSVKVNVHVEKSQCSHRELATV